MRLDSLVSNWTILGGWRDRDVVRHEVLSHDTVVQPTWREVRRSEREFNAMPTERPGAARYRCSDGARIWTNHVDRVAAERLPRRGVIEKPRERDATRVPVVGANVFGERENYGLGEGSNEGEKWSRVRDDGEEKGSEVGKVREGVVREQGRELSKQEWTRTKVGANY